MKKVGNMFAYSTPNVYNILCLLVELYPFVSEYAKDGYLMATAHGICKNCGSLIVLDSKEELCECLFCDCVFPAEEAIRIYNNPEGVTFPNEKQPKREGVKRYNATPVFTDPIPAAIKSSAKTDGNNNGEKLFEITAKDVKAPKKVKIIIAAACTGFVVLIVSIFLPLYLSRMSHRDAITKRIDECFTDITVDVTEENGYAVGYRLGGQTNGEFTVITNDTLNDAKALAVYEAYCALRADEYGYDSSDKAYDDVTVTIYSNEASYTIDDGGKVSSTAYESEEN